jgi:prepilin-type N-terminal cleavage/methylation domain-containing protein
MKLNRAFSLIELSIVILVIGILIVAGMQGKSLYVKMKLAAARSMTQGSPVSGIQDLALWLDATSEAGFVSGIDDQSLVDTWNDTNPQQTNKSNATSSGSKKPLYVTSGINGLPALKCDGVDDEIIIASGSNYYPAAAPEIKNNFTIFLVARPTATHEIDTQSNASATGESGQKYLLVPQQGTGPYGGTDIAGAGISLGTNGISVYEHTANYLPPLAVYSSNALGAASVITLDYNNKTPKVFLNGTSVVTGLTSPKASVFPSASFCSTGFGSFSGYIGEIIVYSKRIPNTKRIQIEKYLGKKWGIKVA